MHFVAVSGRQWNMEGNMREWGNGRLGGGCCCDLWVKLQTSRSSDTPMPNIKASKAHSPPPLWHLHPMSLSDDDISVSRVWWQVKVLHVDGIKCSLLFLFLNRCMCWTSCLSESEMAIWSLCNRLWIFFLILFLKWILCDILAPTDCSVLCLSVTVCEYTRAYRCVQAYLCICASLSVSNICWGYRGQSRAQFLRTCCRHIFQK